MLIKGFVAILNMSLIASYVIGVVLLARQLLKRTPRVYSYALWAIVLFRLILPFSFESAVGLLPNDTQPIAHNVVYQLPQQIDNDVAPDQPLEHAASTFEVASAKGVSALQNAILIGSYIWLAGIFIMLAYSVMNLLKLKNKLVGATPLSARIYLADHIETPFVLGLVKPVIYLPSKLAGAERDFIIMHEQCHIKRLDHLTRALAFVALTLHWFNPLVWLAYHLSANDMEMSCDESVLNQINTDIRTPYSQSLLRFATDKKITPATPLAFGEGNTKARIKNVMHYKKPVLWVSIIAILSVGIIAITLMSRQRENPQNVSPLPTTNQLYIMTDDNAPIGCQFGISDTADFDLDTAVKALPDLQGFNFNGTFDSRLEIHSDKDTTIKNIRVYTALDMRLLAFDALDETASKQKILLPDDKSQAYYYVIDIEIGDKEQTLYFSIGMENEDAEDAIDAPRVTMPMLTANDTIGVGVVLDYADDQKIVFHGYFGLFVYDIKKEKLTFVADLNYAFGTNRIQGDTFVDVIISGDGKNLVAFKNGLIKEDEAISALYVNLTTLEHEFKAYQPFESIYSVPDEQSSAFTGATIGELKYITDQREILLFKNYKL